MTSAAARSREPWWIAGGAGALLAGGPVWHYLATHHYPLARPEAVVMPLAAALVGALVALIAWRIGGWLGGLLFAVLLFVFIDLQFDLHDHVRTIFLAAGCVVLSLMLAARRAAIVCITLGVFYLAGVPRLVARGAAAERPDDATRASSLPLVVHLILDEQWGIGGFRAAGDTATAAFLQKFYTDRGFEVYPGAYSRWAQTLSSIPDVVNLGRPFVIDSVSSWRFRLDPNAYFARLRERGYRIRVYQSTFLDYCHTTGAEVDACDEVSGNSIANFAYFRGPWTRRARIAGRYFLNVTSHTYDRLYRDDAVWRRSVVGGGLRQLALVRDAIASGSPVGRAFFVHVLLPHRPTDVDAECRAHANPAHRIGYREDAVRLTDSAFRAHLDLYAAQSRCAHRAVAQVLQAVDRMAGREGSIVIVHGDHGSRLSQHKRDAMPISGYDAPRLSATFSTLLAVRRPGVPAAVHREPVPTQDFLWHLIQRDFTGNDPGGWRHFVRANASSSATTDTLRELAIDEMIWAPAVPQRALSMGTSARITPPRR